MADTLSKILLEIQSETNSAFGDHHERMTHLIAKFGLLELGPQQGDTSPDFALPNAEGRLTRLDDLVRDASIYLVFVRGLWCPYCTAQMMLLAGFVERLEAVGVKLVIVTPEIAGGASKAKALMPHCVEVLCDPNQGMALSYGAVVMVPPEDQVFLRDVDYDITDLYGNEMWLMPLAMSFLINGKKRIQARWAIADQRKRHDPTDVLNHAPGETGSADDS